MRRAQLKDGTEVTLYTPEYVKARLEEAAQTLRRLPATGCFPQGHKAHWPEVVREFWEEWNVRGEGEREAFADERNRVRLSPSPAQIERMDEALMWFYYIKQPKHRMVVFARSMGVRAAVLARQLNVHRNTLAGWHEAGMQRIVAALNQGGAC